MRQCGGQFNKDSYDPDGDYKLLFESGQEVNTVPVTSTDIVLWKYKSELGKDYKRMLFYFCKGNDYHLPERLKGGNPFCSSEEEEDLVKETQPVQMNVIFSICYCQVIQF